MLQDRHNRIISYLRISVTERCNFRCVYCMPPEGVALSPRDHILSFEEIARVVRVGAALGLTKIRLTGGEPTVRKDLPQLVSMLRSIDGIREIAMTTNASRLRALAKSLKDAGLNRVNISLDTLIAARNFELTRRHFLDDVLDGIASCEEIGLPMKFNAVVMRGVNDDELCELVSFAHAHNAQMRFIEWMPMGMARFDKGNRVVTTTEMLRTLSTRFALVRENGDLANALKNDAAQCDPAQSDPARGWICRKTGARVAFISSMSDAFCATCNRMRLTAEGGLRPCLHQDAETDVRQVLRNGGNDVDIAQAFHDAANLKWRGHQMTQDIPLFSGKDMVRIGG